jgi:cellobiose phosphorylase
LQRIGGELALHPCLPREWTEYELRYRFGSSLYVISVTQRDAGATTLQLDGVEQTGLRFALLDDGNVHNVEATWPRVAT